MFDIPVAAASPPTDADVLLTSWQAQQLAGRSPMTIKRAVRAGTLSVHSRRHGSLCGTKLFASSAVLDWVGRGCPAPVNPTKPKVITPPQPVECPCGCGRPLSMVRPNN